MSTDLSTLTGAYAVNALTGPELISFERHLADCTDCQHEVRELAETAARLGTAVAASPPAELKDRVLDEVARTRQDPPESQPAPGRNVRTLRRRRMLTRVAAAAAVVGIALAGVFGGVAVHSHNQLNNANQQLEQASGRAAEMGALLQAPDAKIVGGGSGEMRATSVASEQLGKVAFLGSGLPPQPSDRAYQLWFMSEDGVSSAGLLPGDREQRDEPMVTTLPAEIAQMAVTVEPAAGSPQPTTDPVLVMSMRQ